MIARLWHGWTKPADGDAYQALLLKTILPEMHQTKGYRGGYVLRKDGTEETEFVVLTCWESMEAVHEFAGEDVSKAVITTAASELLLRGDEEATHYNSFRSG